MANGTRLTVGHYAGNVQKARKVLHDSLRANGVQVPQSVQGPLAAANKAIEEYNEAKKREEKSKEKRDALI